MTSRLLVFVLFFVIFLILKLVFVGGKKAIEVGVEAFDAVNGTDFSKILNLKMPNLAESIIGILTFMSYEDGKIDNIEKSILIHTIRSIKKALENQLSAEQIYAVEEMLYKQINKINNLYEQKDIFYDECFFEENRNLIKNYLFVIKEKADFSIKDMLFKQLISLAQINSQLNQCQAKFIFYIGNNLGYSKSEIKKLLSNDKETHKSSNDFKNKNPYEILGVSENANKEEIKKSYKELVKKFHPDFIQSKGLDEEFLKYAEKRMKEINWAYEKLMRKFSVR